MTSPTEDRMRPASMKQRRFWQHLFAILITLAALLPETQPAQAASAQAPIICSTNNGCPVFPPPDLLYLNQGGIYGATPAQAASLKNLENQAISNIIKAHNLSPNDADAVRSWARNDALGELYASLGVAINTDASKRTADQQNAVAWITAVAQRQNIAAAAAAAREYVKWAGLDRSTYDALLRNNASKSQLESFLSGTPLNYNDTNTSAATGGWCVYRSPAPYGDDYQGWQDTRCYAPSTVIKVPPTPTYDDLVKWGQAKSTYPLLSSPSYASTAKSIALGLSVGLPLGAVLGGTLATIATVTTYATYVQVATAWVRVTGGTVATAAQWLGSVAPFTIAAAASTILVIIAALATAIIVGINVTDAAKLPGKLATLIDDARTTPPDPATFLSSTVGGTNFFSTFVGAAVPAPANRTCDNAKMSLPPGMYPLEQVRTDQVTLLPSIPCLNPTDIPAASASDPQIIVTAKGAASGAPAPSITWKDTASGTTTTARLSGNWFVTQANGATAQALGIVYTDWDGKEQNAWLIGNPTNGYTFLTYSAPADSSTTVSAATCVANGYCGANASIKYIGANGQKYSASVRVYKPRTDLPTYSNAVEASPVSFNANNFTPGGARGEISYHWNFQQAGCGIVSCLNSDHGAGATPTYTWQTGGSYRVDLIADDNYRAHATTSFQVNVAGVAPTLTLAPDCAVNASVTCNSWASNAGSLVSLKGVVGHAGTLDNIVLKVNWGDGTEDLAGAGPNTISLFGNPLTLTSSSARSLTYDLLGKHTYANPGIYYPTVTAINMNNGYTYGGAASQTFVMTVKGTQAINFAPIGGHSYGDVFTISATGGASVNPVTFSTTSACILSNVSGGFGTGSATVTVMSAGYCDIAASQAGTATYSPAPSVTQRVYTLLAPLTVTANSKSMTYGGPVPSFDAQYTGLVNGDAASVVSGLICIAKDAGGQIVSSSTPDGSYPISCSGGSAANYSLSYVAGTLTINPAATATSTPQPPTSTPTSAPTDTTATPTSTPITVGGPRETPTSTAPANTGFPTTSVMDTFDRADGRAGSNWSGSTGKTFYTVAVNKLDVQAGGALLWKATSFGASQEAFVTLSTIDAESPSQGLLLKVQGSNNLSNKGAISVVYDAVVGVVRVSTVRKGQHGVWTPYSGTAATFANGDVLGARALANGSVQVYRNGTLLATVTLSVEDQTFFNATGGEIGIWTALAPNAVLDDFGGGTITL